MIGLRVSQDFAATILEREREREKESEEERGGSGDVRQGSGVGCGIVAELRLLFWLRCLSAAKQPGTQRLEDHRGIFRDKKR
jgi:hypothetical protein